MKPWIYYGQSVQLDSKTLQIRNIHQFGILFHNLWNCDPLSAPFLCFVELFDCFGAIRYFLESVPEIVVLFHFASVFLDIANYLSYHYF